MCTCCRTRPHTCGRYVIIATIFCRPQVRPYVDWQRSDRQCVLRADHPARGFTFIRNTPHAQIEHVSICAKFFTYGLTICSSAQDSTAAHSVNGPLHTPPRVSTTVHSLDDSRGQRSWRNKVTAIWNSLSKTVLDSDTVTSFKSRLKIHLFSQAFSHTPTYH